MKPETQKQIDRKIAKFKKRIPKLEKQGYSKEEIEIMAGEISLKIIENEK